MSFEWQEFINLSKELKKKEERYLRTSISRAYYGIFCICRNRKGFKNYKKSDVYYLTINTCKNSRDIDEKWIGKTLAELRRNRNDADYDKDKEINMDLVERVIAKTKDILQKLGNI